MAEGKRASSCKARVWTNSSLGRWEASKFIETLYVEYPSAPQVTLFSCMTVAFYRMDSVHYVRPHLHFSEASNRAFLDITFPSIISWIAYDFPAKCTSPMAPCYDLGRRRKERPFPTERLFQPHLVFSCFAAIYKAQEHFSAALLTYLHCIAQYTERETVDRPGDHFVFE